MKIGIRHLIYKKKLTGAKSGFEIIQLRYCNLMVRRLKTSLGIWTCQGRLCLFRTLVAHGMGAQQQVKIRCLEDYVLSLNIAEILLNVAENKSTIHSYAPFEKGGVYCLAHVGCMAALCLSPNVTLCER